MPLVLKGHLPPNSFLGLERFRVFQLEHKVAVLHISSLDSNVDSSATCRKFFRCRNGVILTVHLMYKSCRFQNFSCFLSNLKQLLVYILLNSGLIHNPNYFNN